MIPIMDFQRRSLVGPVMKEQEFDMTFARKVREVVSRYSIIKYDPESILVSDGIADAVFQAGADLLAEVGLYNRDTQRVIQFGKEEVEQIAGDAWSGQRQVVFGKGKDEVTIRYRTAQDPRPPVIFMGPSAIPSTEDLYLPFVQSFAQEELAQGIAFSGLISAGGLENKAGTLGEVACSFLEVKYNLEVAGRVGKPGMFIGATSATSPGAIMASCFPGGLERHNVMIPIHLMPEQKVDWNRLLLALCSEERGFMPWTSAISIMGALCRGPEDSAIAQVSNLLAQLEYGHGSIATTGAIHLDGYFSSREAMWSYSAAARASERHIGIPMGAPAQSMAGAGTEMAFYEKAATIINEVASGGAWLWGMGCRNGKGVNVTTGLEGRLVAETALAVSGMEMAKANELIKKILAEYEGSLSSAPQGRTFAELYDVKKVQPKEDYLATYQRAKEKLTGLGVPY